MPKVESCFTELGAPHGGPYFQAFQEHVVLYAFALNKY